MIRYLAIVILSMGVLTGPHLFGQVVNETTITIENGVTATSELDFDNKAGAIVNVKSGAELEMKSDLSNNGTVNFGDGQLTVSSASTLSGNLSIATLNIEANTSLNNTLTVTKVLNLVSGQLNVSSGSLVIRSNASSTAYIDDFSSGHSGTMTGNNVTVQRYVPGSGLNFYLIGSAVNSTNEVTDLGGEISLATINGATDGTPITPTSTSSSCSTTQVDPSSGYGGAFEYDESISSDCIMSGWVVRANGNLNVAQGLAARINGGTTIDFTGSYQTGNITSYALSGTGNNTAAPSFNIVANPFASAINWSVVSTANSSNISGTAFIFQNSGGYSGTYQSYNNIVTTNIASQQGFFVVANTNGATLTFPQNSRITNDPTFYKQSNNVYDSRLDVEVTSNQGFADITYIAFSDNFTNGFDNTFDARKMMSYDAQPTLYTHTNPDILRQGINALALDSVTVVPMGFVPGSNDTFSFNILGLNTFPVGTEIYLRDKKETLLIDIYQTPNYTFQALETDSANRFEIIFKKAPGTAQFIGDPALATNQIQLYPNPAKGLVKLDGLSTTSNSVEIELIDASGKTIEQQKLYSTNGQAHFETAHLTQGLYVVKIRQGNTVAYRKLIKE